MMNIFISPKVSLCLLIIPLILPSTFTPIPRQYITCLCHYRLVCIFLEFYVNGIIKHVLLFLAFSFSLIIFRFIHVVSVVHSFCFSIHELVDIWVSNLGLFQISCQKHSYKNLCAFISL